MYGSSTPDSASMNGIGGDLVDGSGTINPAALNSTRMSSLFFLFSFPFSFSVIYTL